MRADTRGLGARPLGPVCGARTRCAGTEPSRAMWPACQSRGSWARRCVIGRFTNCARPKLSLATPAEAECETPCGSQRGMSSPICGRHRWKHCSVRSSAGGAQEIATLGASSRARTPTNWWHCAQDMFSGSAFADELATIIFLVTPAQTVVPAGLFETSTRRKGPLNAFQQLAADHLGGADASRAKTI